jgi:hypothetical protein
MLIRLENGSGGAFLNPRESLPADTGRQLAFKICIWVDKPFPSPVGRTFFGVHAF